MNLAIGERGTVCLIKCMAAVLFVTCASLGNWSHSAEENSQSPSSQEWLSLYVETEKEAYQAGEEVKLELRLNNSDQHDKTIEQSRVFALYEIEVLLPDRQKAPLTRYGQKLLAAEQPESSNIVLKSGDVQRHTILSLNRIYDMTLEGEYRIVARRRIARQRDHEKPLDLTSNTATVKISG